MEDYIVNKWIPGQGNVEVQVTVTGIFDGPYGEDLVSLTGYRDEETTLSLSQFDNIVIAKV